MKEEGILHHYNTFQDQLLTGTSLLELKALLNSEPTKTIKFFLEGTPFPSHSNQQKRLNVLEGKCNIQKSGELLAITAALRRL
jgi:hypothetical protein